MRSGRQSPAIDGESLRFVLSAGRTGTLFLTGTLPKLEPSWRVEHEPSHSRRMFMLQNAADQGVPIAGALARRLFVRSRQKQVESLGAGSVRIEVNPFLSPLTKHLADHVKPLHVVHMVRDPRTWIPSMANFRAAGWRRYVIDAIPFARPIHPMARARWVFRSRLERHAWWWRRANEKILGLESCAASFRVVRYEDLFLSGEGAYCAALAEIVAGLGGCADPSSLPKPSRNRVNPGRPGKTPAWEKIAPVDRAMVIDIVGPLMTHFGYKA